MLEFIIIFQVAWVYKVRLQALYKAEIKLEFILRNGACS